MNFVRTEKNKMRIFDSFFILFNFAFASMCDYQGSATVRSLRMYMHSLRMASRVTSQPLKKYFSRSQLLWDQLRSCLSPKRRWSYRTLGFKTYSELTCLSLKNTRSIFSQPLPMIYRRGITRNKSPIQKSQSLYSVNEFQSIVWISYR